MKKKYVATLWHINTISCVAIEKETDAYVWIDGRRCSKRSTFLNYFDTWQEAHDFLSEHCELCVKEAQKNLRHARSKFEAVKQMKPDT